MLDDAQMQQVKLAAIELIMNTDCDFDFIAEMMGTNDEDVIEASVHYVGRMLDDAAEWIKKNK